MNKLAIKATNKKSESIDPVETGSYPARVYQIIQIGTIPGFQGQLQNKVRIGFELPTEMMVFDKEKGEQPRVMSQEFTLSFSEKANLRKVITACDPKALEIDKDGLMEEFDVEKLIGKTLLITVAQKPKKDGSGNYAFIDNYTCLPKGMTCAAQINPTCIISYDNWSDEVFNALPSFIKEKITVSNEYKLMKGIATESEAEPF